MMTQDFGVRMSLEDVCYQDILSYNELVQALYDLEKSYGSKIDFKIPKNLVVKIAPPINLENVLDREQYFFYAMCNAFVYYTKAFKKLKEKYNILSNFTTLDDETTSEDLTNIYRVVLKHHDTGLIDVVDELCVIGALTESINRAILLAEFIEQENSVQ